MQRVLKFGGSSLACGDRMLGAIKTANVQRADFVVLSAPGKRNEADIKITDLLFESVNSADKKRRLAALNDACVRLGRIAAEMKVDADTEKLFSSCEKIISESLPRKEGRDYVVSRGEYFSALAFSSRSDYRMLDAKEIIAFDRNGNFDLDKSVSRARKRLKNQSGIVIPGFYGGDRKGRVRLLSRGGSDLSGAVVAAATEGEYFNYTDVNGFCRANPSVVSGAGPLDFISYAEAERAARSGANVIHPGAVAAACKYGVTIVIKNSFDKRFKGTVICKKSAPAKKYGAIAVTGAKNGVSVILGDGFPVCRAAISELERLLPKEAQSSLLRAEEGVITFALPENHRTLAERVLYERLFG
ncbi:MAG: hypothetical protein ACI4SC_01920 [Candidatus Neoclostridium sp.]